MKHDDYREASHTLAVTLALWAGAVAAGTSAGVFARLDEGAFLALASFATAFGSGAVLLDARVRGWLAARGAMVAWTSTFGLAVLLVASGIALARGGGIELAVAPWAPILLFGVPVTVASAIVAVRSAVQAAAPRASGNVRMAGD